MQKTIRLDERGYFLLDLYLQLLILVVVSAGLAFFLAVVHPVQRELEETTPLEFELFWLEMETTLAQSSKVEGGIHPCILRLVSEDDVFIYEKYGQMIRKRKNNLGHEPVLQNVQTCDVEIAPEYIQLHVTFLTGDTIERRMFIASKE